MSLQPLRGFAALMGGRLTPGVYGWPTEALDVDDAELVSLAEDAGWLCGRVNVAEHSTKQELLRAIGEALEFPDYYGVNLDALADCLADLPQKSVLLLDEVSAELPAGLLVVLEERSEDAPAFAGVLRGRALPDGLPLLGDSD